MTPLQTHELAIQIEGPTDGRLCLNWTGKSTSRDPAQVLRPFLDEVITSASSTRSAVEMHFEAMEHFNSSTVAELIRVINTSRTAHVPLSIYYSSTRKWQELSFKALERAMRPFQTQQSPAVRIMPVGGA